MCWKINQNLKKLSRLWVLGFVGIVSTYVEGTQMGDGDGDSDGDGDGDGVIVQIASKWAVSASHCFFRDGVQTVGPHYNLQQCLWKIIILLQEMITNVTFSFPS